jgi:hypothetical protein
VERRSGISRQGFSSAIVIKQRLGVDPSTALVHVSGHIEEPKKTNNFGSMKTSGLNNSFNFFEELDLLHSVNESRRRRNVLRPRASGGGWTSRVPVDAVDRAL